MREEYKRAELSEANCQTNPFQQFSAWFEIAQVADLKEPNAMALATATPDGKPSCRIVLLKEFSEAGFVFYTNYGSRKGQEIKTNPFCALTFWWAELERQVRIEGRAEPVSRAQTEAYFQRRPKGSRLGALASHQSQVLPSRQPLRDRLLELEAQYAGTDNIPVPETWGGYCVVPYSMEFWQGRPNRLHDRLRYRKEDGTKDWILERLAP